MTRLCRSHPNPSPPYQGQTKEGHKVDLPWVGGCVCTCDECVYGCGMSNVHVYMYVCVCVHVFVYVGMSEKIGYMWV